MLVTAFEMGMSEEAFWQCTPKIFKLKVEAYLRTQYRGYLIGVYSQGLTSDKLSLDMLFKTMRLGEATQNEEVEEILIEEDKWDNFLKQINK